MHLLEREIILNATPKEVWAFLATPVNLNRLTPPALDFKILSDVPAVMHSGLIIVYEIRIPLFGRRRWLTEIKHIREGEFFVDEQRLGPYKFWCHQHFVESCENGKSRMVDRVYYRLPFGPLGLLIHHLFVKRMLNEIFDYRAERLRELFG